MKRLFCGSWDRNFGLIFCRSSFCMVSNTLNQVGAHGNVYQKKSYGIMSWGKKMTGETT